MILHFSVADAAKLCFLDVKCPNSLVDMGFTFMVRYL